MRGDGLGRGASIQRGNKLDDVNRGVTVAVLSRKLDEQERGISPTRRGSAVAVAGTLSAADELDATAARLELACQCVSELGTALNFVADDHHSTLRFAGRLEERCSPMSRSEHQQGRTGGARQRRDLDVAEPGMTQVGSPVARGAQEPDREFGRDGAVEPVRFKSEYDVGETTRGERRERERAATRDQSCEALKSRAIAQDAAQRGGADNEVET